MLNYFREKDWNLEIFDKTCAIGIRFVMLDIGQITLVMVVNLAIDRGALMRTSITTTTWLDRSFVNRTRAIGTMLAHMVFDV